VKLGSLMSGYLRGRKCPTDSRVPTDDVLISGFCFLLTILPRMSYGVVTHPDSFVDSGAM